MAKALQHLEHLVVEVQRVHKLHRRDGARAEGRAPGVLPPRVVHALQDVASGRDGGVRRAFGVLGGLELLEVNPTVDRQLHLRQALATFLPLCFLALHFGPAPCASHREVLRQAADERGARLRSRTDLGTIGARQELLTGGGLVHGVVEDQGHDLREQLHHIASAEHQRDVDEALEAEPEGLLAQRLPQDALVPQALDGGPLVLRPASVDLRHRAQQLDAIQRRSQVHLVAEVLQLDERATVAAVDLDEHPEERVHVALQHVALREPQPRPDLETQGANGDALPVAEASAGPVARLLVPAEGAVHVDAVVAQRHVILTAHAPPSDMVQVGPRSDQHGSVPLHGGRGDDTLWEECGTHFEDELLRNGRLLDEVGVA
mmetsp:Transcript_92606/g.293684  ORF Transcript_92606/g.293684 Transcript_92606/m.293684 type:complete len:375 (-) Transcript_92606:1117-2241(-)